ncbi:serine/threonine protein kinase [Tuwongella immobilis]|uniref:Protein kinase domain-containing protein n=1 Tax=Tuwongella immobilis TaxID=692036 RepID=A0A6C2YTG5_9BACT
MAVVTTSDDLLSLLRKSGAVDLEPLDEFVNSLQLSQGIPAEPKKLADQMVAAGLLTKFQSRFLLQGKWRNLVLNGKYRLLDLIGSGGMGTVYLCEHIHMRRRVALKVLPNSLLNHPTAVQRFFREARALARLDHPNVVRAYDLEKIDQLYALVLEYVEGLNLYDLVQQRGPLPPLVAAHYVAQAAWGLQHAYEGGWVHRDIKPNNLLVDRSGTIKLLDLGLARLLGSSTEGITQKHDQKQVLGTADFLSPEQAISSSDVDIRSDVYALGATLYYLLAGHPPFPTGSLAQKLISHQTKEPTPIQQIRSDVPPTLAAVLVKMMKKSPADRFQTPADILAELVPMVEQTSPVLSDFDSFIPSRNKTGLSSTSNLRTPAPNSTASMLRLLPRASSVGDSPSTITEKPSEPTPSQGLPTTPTVEPTMVRPTSGGITTKTLVLLLIAAVTLSALVTGGVLLLITKSN